MVPGPVSAKMIPVDSIDALNDAVPKAAQGDEVVPAGGDPPVLIRAQRLTRIQ